MQIHYEDHADPTNLVTLAVHELAKRLVAAVPWLRDIELRVDRDRLNLADDTLSTIEPLRDGGYEVQIYLIVQWKNKDHGSDAESRAEQVLRTRLAAPAEALGFSKTEGWTEMQSPKGESNVAEGYEQHVEDIDALIDLLHRMEGIEGWIDLPPAAG